MPSTGGLATGPQAYIDTKPRMLLSQER